MRNNFGGLKRACLYSLPPHKLGYCGPEEKKTSLILDFIKNNQSSREEIEDILKKFVAAYMYYKMIANENGIKNPFSKKVIEAYWLGNNLLDVFLKKDKVIPFHAYHVLVVGSITGKIVFDDKLRDLCRISWGQVKELENDKVLVEYQPLIRKKGKFALGSLIAKEVKWNKDFVPKMRKGDKVSIHWDTVIEIISGKELKNLEKYTLMIMENTRARK